MNNAIYFDSPPKVRLTFRVGLVGHRPNRLKPEEIPSLSAQLNQVLSGVAHQVESFAAANPGLFAKQQACLRAISPLAEGTDRIFARQALKLGCELCCPLPFSKEEFENDFKPGQSLLGGVDSVADFNSVLAEARGTTGVTMFELDGVRSDAPEAYAAAGQVVINQSDLLLVVWDGGGENKRGGTYETMTEAVKFSVPVLWIDARSPHSWQLLRTEADLPGCSADRCVPRQTGKALEVELKTIVEHALSPPRQGQGEEPKHKREEQLKRRRRSQYLDLREPYFAEMKPRFNRYCGWKLFRDFISTGKLRMPQFRVKDFEEAVMAEWSEDSGNPVERWANHQLRSHYAWSDKLADLYGDKYRSSFVFSYFSAAFAVLFGVLAHVSHARIWSVAELVAVLLILVRVLQGNFLRWHERWLEYRLVAELVRQLRFLAPIGGARPFPRLPQHLSFGDPANTWMYWHVRSIDRAIGLPDAKVTPEYLAKCRQYIERVVRGQIDFHRNNADRSEKIEHRLHVLGLTLFGATLAVIVLHLTPIGSFVDQRLEKWDPALIAGAVLPAFGAAMAAINNQGEFARIKKRSKAIASKLEQDLERLPKQDEVLRSSDLAGDALRVAQTMVDEVLDWRLVFLDRPLITPA